MIIELLTGASVLIGAGFLLTSAIGLLRFPDIYCRGHALGLASTLGIGLLLLGLWLQVGGAFNGFKIILAVVLQFASIPIASHLIGLVALQKRMPRFARGQFKRGDGSTAFPFSGKRP